jgi:hypothetical protein
LPGAALAVKGLADAFLGLNAEYRKETMTFKPGEVGKPGSGGKQPFVKSNAGFFETLLATLLPFLASDDSAITVARDIERRRLMKQGVPVNLATGELVRDDMNMDRGVFLGSNVGQLPASQVSESAAAAGAKSFMKPSLALNALQRIGAAVSQSADPIAIEKDNNVLLKRIANNTKDTARNTE